MISYDHVEWEKAYIVTESAGDNGESAVVLPEISAKQVTNRETKHVTWGQVSFSNLSRTENLTRGQIAAVKLPKVGFIADKDVLQL